jgi:hypothetical protein
MTSVAVLAQTQFPSSIAEIHVGARAAADWQLLKDAFAILNDRGEIRR